MYVDRIMTRDVVTANETTRLAQLSELMKLHKMRHLPVVDDAGHLVGILSHRDVQRAEPSPITSLDRGEINYLLSKVTAGQIMHRNVVACRPDTLVEQAGCLMRERRVGCLPVVDGGKLVGILTGVDLVDFFLEITGCQVADATRIAVHLDEGPGQLARLLEVVADAGGDLVTVVSPYHPDGSGRRLAIFRYRADAPQAVADAIASAGWELVTLDLPDAA